MSYAEDDLLPLSALQHLLFCERQCALIHVEGLWAENALTQEGRHLHRKVDEGPDELRRGVRTTRSLPLRSLRLGLIGRADAVEFHAAEGEAGARAFGDRGGRWVPLPVEYKRGKAKRDHSDEVQLCAQALCLEEMLEVPVPAGALFYGTTRRRTEVPFGPELRARTEDAVRRLHELVDVGITPTARREPKCDGCSLLNLCLPSSGERPRSAVRYVAQALAAREALPIAPPHGGTP
jgi:CRISPR-associated exonuclease Cas4